MFADKWVSLGSERPRERWEGLADRKANSLAASTEKYLVCFVSQVRDEG